MPPEIGETAPDFEALLCDGEVFQDARFGTCLGDRGAVLYFQSFVFSAIARHWWKRFDRRGWDESDEVPVYGIGRDGPFAQNEFLRQIKSPFESFSDVDGHVTDTYELRLEREGMVHTSTPRRSVFVVDSDMTVRYRWISPDTVSPPPAEEIEEAVASL